MHAVLFKQRFRSRDFLMKGFRLYLFGGLDCNALPYSLLILDAFIFLQTHPYFQQVRAAENSRTRAWEAKDQRLALTLDQIICSWWSHALTSDLLQSYVMNSGLGVYLAKTNSSYGACCALNRVETWLNYSGHQLVGRDCERDYSCKMFVIKGCRWLIVLVLLVLLSL